MNDPDDLDALISKSVATYIPEPAPLLATSVIRRLQKQRRERWFLVPIGMAAGIAAMILLLRQPVVTPRVDAYTHPALASMRVPEAPHQPVLPIKRARHHRLALTKVVATKPVLTKEERLLLAVAEQLPNQFPQLVAIPQSQPIQPIKIADLQPPPPLIPGDVE